MQGVSQTQAATADAKRPPKEKPIMLENYQEHIYYNDAQQSKLTSKNNLALFIEKLNDVANWKHFTLSHDT